MRPLGLSLPVLLLVAGQVRAQADDAPPSPGVPPAAEPAPPAEPPPPSPGPAPAAAPPPPPVAAPAPRPPSSDTPVYILPAQSYPRPAPAPESFTPRASPLYPGQGANGAYANPAYPSPAYQPPPAAYAQPSYAPPQTYVAPRPYEAPVYNLPPLPPGYVYVPAPATGANPGTLSPAEVARREQLYRELYRVESRVDQLEREHIRTGGPIAMMVIGYGATSLATGVALSAYDSAERIQLGWDGEWYDHKLDIDDDGDVDERDERRFRKLARISAGVAAGTLTLGILSTVRLAKRIAARRAQRLELAELTHQRQNLRQQLDYGAAVGAGQTGFTIQGKF